VDPTLDEVLSAMRGISFLAVAPQYGTSFSATRSRSISRGRPRPHPARDDVQVFLAPDLVKAIDGTFGPTGSTTAPAAVKLTPVTGTAAGGGEIAALSAGSVALAPPVAPASFNLTIPQASVPPALALRLVARQAAHPAQLPPS
jgi:hypothetical protein